MFGENINQFSNEENDEYCSSDDTGKGKRKKGKIKESLLSLNKAQSITIKIDNNDIDEDDDVIYDIGDDIIEEETSKYGKKNKKNNEKNKKEVKSKKQSNKAKKGIKGKKKINDGIGNDNQLYRDSSFEAKLENEKIVNQPAIESGFINIQLNSPIVLPLKKKDEVNINEKQSVSNRNYSSNSSNKRKLKSNILSISERDNNKEAKEINDKNNGNPSSSINTGIDKLKSKYHLKVTIPKSEEVNNKFPKPNENIQMNNNMPTNLNILNAINNISNTISNTDSSNNLISKQTHNQSISRNNALSHHQILTNDQNNMFFFKPDFAYDREMFSEFPQYYPNITTNQSHLRSPFVFESLNAPNNIQIQMNQAISNLIKTMTPPIIKQPDSKYGGNMGGNYFQFPFGNESHLNQKRHREEVTNTFTPLSQERFHLSPLGIEFFNDTNRNAGINNSLSNAQPLRTLTHDIIQGNNTSSEVTHPDYLLSPILNLQPNRHKQNEFNK